ncbi:MucB/RseB C-terminal domain-containing protein [Limisalsivibrio acetivorans]|uniref:MucB/RseB C-terminal domain-containing protein n=1 Tax=Limisalsivibrio acetivorans TaxID=1304888 RepID=UPI0003B72704|nr:MucB/RseB C-terminal domain-containing protein [Limisalsivibrio acetivorans]
MRSLLLLLLLIPLTALAEPKVYFKIAVDEEAYTSFLLDNLENRQSKLHTLASRLKESFFELKRVRKEFYNIYIQYGLKYNNRTVVQYELEPTVKDRFRHVIVVDEAHKTVLRREVYDTSGRLVYAYSFEGNNDVHRPDAPKHASISYEEDDTLLGFGTVFRRTFKDGSSHYLFSDGLNKFSVFTKKTELELEDNKRVLYGNYVLRKKSGDLLYTVVGTIPFEQMEKVIETFESGRKVKNEKED